MGEVVADQVEPAAGAREMLMAALNEEVDAYLGRGRYFRGYRNGRRAGDSPWAAGRSQPRVRDIPSWPGAVRQNPAQVPATQRHDRRHS